MKASHLVSCGLFLMVVPGFAQAGNLYRCIGADGQVSYQDVACDAGRRTDRIIAFTPDPVVAVVADRGRTVPGKRTGERRRQAPRRGVGARTGQPTRSEDCRRAKSRRTAQLEQLGLKRTFDDLSRIDAAVRSVCNGY
jgi:hypothetical protein